MDEIELIDAADEAVLVTHEDGDAEGDQSPVDTARIERAHADHAQRVKNEADARTALDQAQRDAEAADKVAQKAADGGASASELSRLEEVCEAARRTVAVARRMADGATKRRKDGERTRDQEVKQASGKAIAATVQRRMALLQEAYDVFSRLKEIDAAFQLARADMLAMHAAAGIQSSAALQMHTSIFQPLNPNRLIPMDDFMAQMRGAGFDADTGKFGWQE